MSSLSSKWAPEKEWKIIPMNHGFFLFRFISIVDRDVMLNNGP